MQKRDFWASKGKWLSIPFLVTTTISPGFRSRTKRAPMMSSAQVSDAKIQAPSRSPSTSGLMPSGSRQPIIFFDVSATSENAPSSWRTASMKRELMSRSREVATRCRIVSVSEVEEKIAPCFCRLRCTVMALVMLPLCAIAMPPSASSANSGWTLRRPEPPVVA
jgi:hypothetical protein